MLTAYDVDKINERIDTLIRIKSDPFFGRYVLEKQNGEKVDVFVGTHDFQNGSIQIISTWSPVGRAFQQNLTNFEIGVTKYRVLEKYIYAVNHNRIVSIKNESPR